MALGLLPCGVIAAMVGTAAEAATPDAFLFANALPPVAPPPRSFRGAAPGSAAAPPLAAPAPVASGVLVTASGLAAAALAGGGLCAAARRNDAGRRAGAQRRGSAAAVSALNRASRIAPSEPLFDPLGWADEDNYEIFSSFELVLGRVAMLAAVGLPVSELVHEDLAASAGLPSRLSDGGRSPMALNGSDFGPAAELLVATFLATLGVSYFARTPPAPAGRQPDKGDEVASAGEEDVLNPSGLSTLTGNVSPILKTVFGTAERLNGRIAMVAVTAMVVQELVTGKAVVDSSPLFFGIH